MHPLLRHTLIILVAVVLTGNLTAPHICLDDDAAGMKIEQQAKLAVDQTHTHKDTSKAGDHCCIAHHCCVAKLLNQVQPITFMTFVSNENVFAPAADYFFSFDPKGVDRPPKFFA